MPIYVFKCPSCNFVEERLVKSTGADENVVFCQKCATDMEKQLTTAHFRWSKKQMVKEDQE